METENIRINREHKDRLFRWIFNNKKDLLELYNAVNGTSYADPEQLEINTLEDVIYMGMKNDVSFLITDVLNLYEHQSSYNPNMPFREFLYLADEYRRYAKQKDLNLYSSKLQKLPMPQCLVFYNGLKKEPDRKELLLSDAFIQSDRHSPCLELRVIMLNINWGHNRELMDKCRKLSEYAQFVDQIRQYLAGGLDRESAVSAAVESCIESGILKDLLIQHKAEVMDMLLTEYNEELDRKELFELGREEGLSEGSLQARREDILEVLSRHGDIPKELRLRIAGQNDLNVLRQWFQYACLASSISEFVRSLN